MMSKLQLSERAIMGIPFSAGTQYIVRDADLPGFFLMVGARSKAFMIQADLRADGKRQSIRLKIGDVGTVTTREARAKAKGLLGQISEGIDPRPKAEVPAAPISSGRDPTLRMAWEAYRDGHMRRKGRSSKTERSYADHVERLMKAWHDQPLSILGNDPSLVRDRHDELSRECGTYIANGCMRTLRAIYNHARKSARGLPAENPVFAVDWNPEHRRDTGMGLQDLPRWFSQLREIENPVRRELHLFLLLSGSRPEVIKQAKPEHLNLRDRLLFIPEPKGGKDKAFCIPLSRQTMLCLVRAILFGRTMHPVKSTEWIFPADSASGHLVEHKEPREMLSHWGNELRQTYRTVGQIADISDVDMHLLMNHSLPGVNAGYITRSKLVGTHLRVAQQKLSDVMIAASKNGERGQKFWPNEPVRHSLANFAARSNKEVA